MASAEPFNLDAFLASVWQALNALVCHVWFDAAVHGMAMAAAIAIAGIILHKRGLRFGVPLLSVGKKLAIFCLFLLAPGALSLITHGKLPDAGVFNVSSLGFIAFWSLISLHLSAEEMNFQWF